MCTKRSADTSAHLTRREKCNLRELLFPPLQGLDTEENVMAPKVVEALLGTRFQGRDFLRSPLVRLDAPQKCQHHPAGIAVAAHHLGRHERL